MKIEHDGSITGVIIACPCLQQITAFTTGSLYATGQLLTASGIASHLTWLSMSDIIESRNTILTKFYDAFPTASHLLFVDSDMNFTPGLIKKMFDFDKDVAGVLYCRREFPVSLIGEKSEDHVVKDGFMKMNGVGAGVLLIKRSIVKTIIEAMPDLVEPAEPVVSEKTGIKRSIRAFDKMRNPKGTLLSEDFSFCERVRQVGGEVWANIDEQIGHVGPFEFAVRYSDALEKQEAA